MKERLVTLALALGAFVLFYALFVPKPAALQDGSAMPLSTEVRGAGYQGAWRWLQAQGIPVISLRDRYSRLSAQGMPDTGNLMITTVPQKVSFREDELRSLEEWLDRGNSLLVMAALDDTPEWALRAADPREFLKRVTALDFDVVQKKAAADEDEGKTESETSNRGQTLRDAVEQLITRQRGSLVAQGSHPLLAGIQSVVTESDYPASRWLPRSRDSSALLELAVRTDRAEGSTRSEPAVWLKRRGNGQIFVVAYASPFSNALIGNAGNARLFANVVAWSRTGQGAVLFDDVHQGLASYYDAKAFFGDPRLHRTLLWIFLLWLLFVLGWQRLRPRADGWNPVDVTTFIKVTGGFIAGRVPESVAAQRLCANFFNMLRQRLALPLNGLPVWDWLATQAVVPASDLEQLRQFHARAQGRQHVDLVRLQNCLTKMMGNLK